MKALQSLYTRGGGLILLLCACAIFTRTLVPVGWMPMPDVRGFRITPCSGTGPMFPATDMAMHMHHASSHGHHPPPDTPIRPCPYSALSLALEEPTLPSITAPQFTPQPLVFMALPAAVAIGLGLAAPPPYQTGPPTGR